MYTIIGGDGKEYGPATVDQIKAWIVAGRADGNTQAKREGAQEWRRLADIPEFQPGAPGAFAPSDPPPVFSGADPAPHPAAAHSPRQIDIGDCYERGWRLLRSRFWPLVGVTALVIAICLAGRVHLALQILLLIFIGPIQAGLEYYFLKTARQQQPTVADAFAGFTSGQTVQLVLVFMVGAALITVGAICLILPGIYLLVAYWFAPLLVIDRKMDFWSALELSRKTVTEQWWRTLGLILLGMLFYLIGLAVLLVGVFVTVPIVLGAKISAYQDLFP